MEIIAASIVVLTLQIQQFTKCESSSDGQGEQVSKTIQDSD